MQFSITPAAAAAALALGLATAASAAGADPAQHGDHASPRVTTHAPAGFRFYRPSYRVGGKGALVSVQLCRLPGWAAASPQHLRVERLDAAGHPDEIHEHALPRLGFRLSYNCSFATLALAQEAATGETINICATSGGASCPAATADR